LLPRMNLKWRFGAHGTNNSVFLSNIIFLSFKKKKKFIPWTCKNHVQILCILSYTKTEHLDLSMCIFKSTNFIKFCYFCVFHNIMNFVIQFYLDLFS
jgi:hypothetical protein